MTIESDATKGSASQPLAKRIGSLVKHQCGHKDPPVVRRTTVVQLTNTMRVRDGDTSVTQAIQIAADRGDVIAFKRDGTRYVGLPEPATVRYALGDPDESTLREVVSAEAQRDEPRREYIAAVNQLLND